MLKFLYFFIAIISLNLSIASTTNKEESFREFEIALSNNGIDSVLKKNQDVDYQYIYENNKLTSEQRYVFYKRIINLQEIRKWDSKLKSIVLIKLVNYDLQNDLPAYLKFNEGRTVFMGMVNQFMKEEFAFIDKLKADVIEDARLKGEVITNVEFDEAQMNDMIDIVYNKLVSEYNLSYLFVK